MCLKPSSVVGHWFSKQRFSAQTSVQVCPGRPFIQVAGMGGSVVVVVLVVVGPAVVVVVGAAVVVGPAVVIGTPPLHETASDASAAHANELMLPKLLLAIFTNSLG